MNENKSNGKSRRKWLIVMMVAAVALTLPVGTWEGESGFMGLLILLGAIVLSLWAVFSPPLPRGDLGFFWLSILLALAGLVLRQTGFDWFVWSFLALFSALAGLVGVLYPPKEESNA